MEKLEEASPRAIGPVLSTIAPLLGRESRLLSLKLRSGRFVEEDLNRANDLLSQIVSNSEFWEKLSGLGGVVVRYEDGIKVLLLIIRTYIQSSGRMSRLFPGGLSKGVAFLIEEGSLLNAFVKRATNFDIEFKPIDQVNLESLKEEIDSHRKKIRKLKGKKVPPEMTPKTLLFIVEVPNKTRTIASFFGRPSRRNIEYQEAIKEVYQEIRSSVRDDLFWKFPFRSENFLIKRSF